MLLLAGALIALLAVALVMEPIVRPVAGAAAILRPDSDDDDITPGQRRRDRALAALKEIEFDQATGKLSDADYARLQEKYTAEALDALRGADGRTGGQAVGEAATVGRQSAGPPVRRRFCEECGAPLGKGKFCEECGTKIAA